MFEILNGTGCNAGFGLFMDAEGRDIVSVAVKATFILPAEGGAVRLAEAQLPVLYKDEHHGDPAETSIRYPADVLLGKVATDIGLVGHAHAPRGRPVPHLPVGLAVGPLRKSVLVLGDRVWRRNPGGIGFLATNPVPFATMPLLHERAFGGVDETAEAPSSHDKFWLNPVGTGFRVNADAVDGLALPNLEDPADRIESWQSRPRPAALGFVAPAWLPRRTFAGTYDAAWQDSQFPLLPKDFDLRFFNCAALGLTADGFLAGGEPVILVNLSPAGRQEFVLPRWSVVLLFHRNGEVEPRRADLWTVVFEPDQGRFYMVWGAALPVGKLPSRLRRIEVRITGEPEPAADDRSTAVAEIA